MFLSRAEDLLAFVYTIPAMRCRFFVRKAVGTRNKELSGDLKAMLYSLLKQALKEGWHS